jgi:PPOX class probable F420-dependent enzyme
MENNAKAGTEEFPIETHADLGIRRLTAIDAPVRKLLEDTNMVTVCTLTRSGVIHAPSLWVHTDGENVLVNSLQGRAWVANLERDPRVTCTVVNLKNPYEFVQIRGKATTPTTEGGRELIDVLAKKYLGLDEYPFHRPDEPRVVIRVVPDKVIHMIPSPETEDATQGTVTASP